MVPMKLNIHFAGFPYGGVGATSSEVPALRTWFAKVMVAAKNDKRIGEITSQNYSDTPVTMTRNSSVLAARAAGADVLIMFDSDMHPDVLLGEDPGAKPFFESSFDFLYHCKTHGTIASICAPYCGAPPDRLPFCFTWRTGDAEHADGDMRLQLMTRDEVAERIGIHPVPAQPTGLIMFDMELFEATDPKHEFKRLLESGMDKRAATALTKPWFYYEYPDIYQAKKDSTEDVTATRDLGLAVLNRRGYSPLFCNFDSWAGHYKPECVSKPRPITSDQVNEKYRTAALAGRHSGERLMVVRNGRLDHAMAEAAD